MRRFTHVIAAALLAGACGGSTTPTPPPPPPVEDPPKITCPAPQTVQLTTGTSIAVTYSAPTTVGGRAPVATVCTPASGSLFTVGLSTVTCIATDALQRTDPCAFAVTVLAPPKLTTTTFLAFGDSITWGEDGRNSATSTTTRFGPRVQFPAAQTYPGVLQQSLTARYATQTAAIRVDNGGLPGEAITNPATSDAPTALTRYAGLLPGHGAVLIMEGTNDLQKAHGASSQAAQNDIMSAAAAGLRTMVRDAKSAGARPFLATVPPMNPTGARGQLFGWELVADYNNRIAAVASLEQIPLVDVNKAFAGNLSLLGSDGVHPTADGYKVIADAFFAAIKSNLESTASSVTAPSFRRR